jgi:hypothetical protein
MPWMVAGDAGNVDLVYYKANTGLNSNVAALDTNGNPCTPTAPLVTGLYPCASPNPSVWNVYFAQSQNALNTGPNFKSVQISDHPNHLGQICTSGLGCTPFGNRDLLDFFTVDIDHLGAANVIWADDNNQFSFARNKFSRQIAGNSVFKNTSINLQSSWPITDHAISDTSGDVFDGAGLPKGSCPGMDLLAANVQRSGTLLTVSLTLNNAPAAFEAIGCSVDGAATGGLWGIRFWAASSTDGTNDYYAAYRDNPPDGGPRVEAGRMDNDNVTLTSTEFDPANTTIQSGFPGGTCSFPVPALIPPALPTTTVACTITFTVDLAALGVKSGDGLYSITPLSVYIGGRARPSLAITASNSEQADAGTAFDVAGTGTTAP